jgi:hypothetical protein
MLKRILDLSTGLKRLLLVLSLLIPFFILTYKTHNPVEYYFEFITLFVFFWVSVRVILWIYDGFKSKD